VDCFTDRCGCGIIPIKKELPSGLPRPEFIIRQRMTETANIYNKPEKPGHSRRRRSRRRFRSHKKKVFEFKSAAEPMLNGVFSRIGKPEESQFVPDDFQVNALKAIQKADCLVMAPTGSGKTWIAEKAIASVIEKGGRAWYASPLKALSNSKWVEFSGIFGPGMVGILTGDTKENPDAPIIVGTTEILRNQLYDSMHVGENLNCDLVVLDEAHFLGDLERGVVWEEIMIYLPSRVNLLMLSATIGNGYEIASWLSSIRDKQCVVIEETKRPVPLYPLFLHPTGKIMPLLNRQRLYGKVEAFLEKSRNKPGRRSKALKTPSFGEIIEALREFNLLPAIFFLKSRSECNLAVRECRSGEFEPDEEFDRDLHELLEKAPFLEEHRQLPALRHWRVAAHHGGQLPAWKFLVEEMMKKGHLDAIFATSTVAAGVNFPARTIVLFNSDQFNGHEFLPLNATGFHQMTGRSGRRGKDKIGFLLNIPGRNMDLDYVRRLLHMNPEEITSRIRNDFSMVLNLLLAYRPEDVRDIFERSLAAYQKSVRKTDSDRRIGGPALWRDFKRHVAFLKMEGFVDSDNRLTEDGKWASNLRLDQPLLIAEGLRKGIFPTQDEALLAALIAPFVTDRNDDIYVSKRDLPPDLYQAYKRMITEIEPLADRMHAAGFPINPLPLWTSKVVYEWARGCEWGELMERSGIAEGDLVMLISRTADHLRQLYSLRDTYPETAALAQKARETILREPVVFD